jgi:hypothetical protein
MTMDANIAEYVIRNRWVFPDEVRIVAASRSSHRSNWTRHRPQLDTEAFAPWHLDAACSAKQEMRSAKPRSGRS